MKNFKIKSYCKVNLSLRVIKKLKNGYHNISSLITFCDLHDVISISKINFPKDKISFSGNFKRNISKNSNTVLKVLHLLRKNKLISKNKYKINIQKNIPHGSGLGGGSSNAADLLNHFNTKNEIGLNYAKMEKIAFKIGSDVPICLKKNNTFLDGKNNKIIRLKHKFRLNLLILYPDLICSTKKIFKKNNKISEKKNHFYLYKKKQSKLIQFLKSESNDLEKVVIRLYPKIKQAINYISQQKGCYFSRITGSGSACIGIFSNRRNAIYAQKLIKKKYPKYWCVVSKTI